MVSGREFAETGYGGWDELEGFIDLFFGGEAGERETNACAGAGGWKTHCGEDVGGFGCAGLTG